MPLVPKFVRRQAGGVVRNTDHVYIETDLDNKNVRINNRSYTQTSGNSIGFQTKPSQTVNGGECTGCEISPRVQDGITLSGSLVGTTIAPDLKGTSTGTIAGDVRGAQIEMVTSNSGTRTISGYVTALRIRAVFSATTITGKFTPMRIEKPEAQTNSKTYDAVIDFTSTASDAWNDDPGTELNNPSGTVKGYFKVIVNGNDRYVALYEKGNLAD